MNDELTSPQEFFLLLFILILGVFLIWGMCYPWKTERQYVSNLTWKRTISEKYDTRDCGYESVTKTDFDGNLKTVQEYKCHTNTHTVNTFVRTGSYKEEVKWPEYHKERTDSYLDKDEYYYVIFKSDNAKNTLTLHNQNDWKKYHVENLYLVTTSPFGRVIKTVKIESGR